MGVLVSCKKIEFELRPDLGCDVLAVNKVLSAPIFLHLRNFEMERYTQEKHGMIIR